MNKSKLSGYQWILVLVGVGFLTMAVEVRYLHLSATKETWVAWIPTCASVAALLGVGLGISSSSMGRKVGAGILALVAIAGLVGVYFHTELKPERFSRLFGNVSSDEIKKDEAKSEKTVERDSESRDEKDGERDGEKDKDNEEGSAPPLAPLAMLGLGLIGVMATVARQDSVK